MKPKLQLALDAIRLDQALDHLPPGLADSLDVLEVGTMPILSSGADSVRRARIRFPGKEIVADAKIADGAAVLVPLFLDAGADVVTLLGAANLPTAARAQELARERGAAVQMELCGSWQHGRLDDWKALGISRLTYHRCFDLGKDGWTQEDLVQAKELADKGFEVYVSGGIELKTLELLKDIPIAGIIVGRGILDYPDPAARAAEYQRKISACWKD